MYTQCTGERYFTKICHLTHDVAVLEAFCAPFGKNGQIHSFFFEFANTEGFQINGKQEHSEDGCIKPSQTFFLLRKIHNFLVQERRQFHSRKVVLIPLRGSGFKSFALRVCVKDYGGFFARDRKSILAYLLLDWLCSVQISLSTVLYHRVGLHCSRMCICLELCIQTVLFLRPMGN